ncbi:MAG: HincII family type II restriction endonuclease [Bacteroidales bacterium]|nr:HincII family type II restriction endonuclease [Bacteroidales bacterium]
MRRIDFNALLEEMIGSEVERPNRATSGTLSGHAAGEPFEKSVYQHLKSRWPNSVFKQYEYLNDLYLKNPKVISVEARYALLDSPTVLFLLSRGDKATREWSPENVFQEKQNDTADIVFYDNGYYDLIDVKTRNRNKDAQAPNIISAYKLATTCANMIDNDEFDNLGINYIEIDWIEKGNMLECVGAHYGDLFKADPKTLYINWAAAMQIQFHVCNLDQSWAGSRKEWAKEYIKVFVESAKHRCQRMQDMYITPFLKYLD